MKSDSLTTVQTLLQQAASLLLYQSVLTGEVGQAFLILLQEILSADRTLAAGSIDCMQAYGLWFRLMAATNQSWRDYLVSQILTDDNAFSRQVQTIELEQMPTAIVAAAQHDLQCLASLAECTSQQLSLWVQMVCKLPTPPVTWTDAIALESPWGHSDWATAVESLAAYYRQQGTGIFAEYAALRWQTGQLVGIAAPDRSQLTDLVGYEWQKEALLKNTEFLLNGYPALHVLLYGSRGSGKSSLVKALLNQFHDRGLRLLEVAKADLTELPLIVDRLRNIPQKFIVFVDDLSFEEDEDAYKALKVVLEGSMTARPQNVVVYATSNRRHLIREFFSDRPRPKDADEIHNWDTVQEKLSFSDRFGLTLTFEPADQKTYLAIVHHLAKQAGIDRSDVISTTDLEAQALQWATRHNGRSGRTARQFVDFLRSDLALKSS